MKEVERRIKNDLKDVLSEYRYSHCLRVAEVARGLACVYHYDAGRAYLIGLVHDIAKEFSDDDNEYYINKYNLSKELLDTEYRKMVHAYVGACIAREKYGFSDEECHAISSHTVGDIPMSLIDKIVFVADKIEPFKDYIGIEEERRMASIDINKATIMCLENHHKKLIRERKKIYPKSMEVLEYLKNNS